MKATSWRKEEIESPVHCNGKAWGQESQAASHIGSAIRKQEKMDARTQIYSCILFYPALQPREGIIYVQTCLTSVKSLHQFLQTSSEVILLDNSWSYQLDHQDKSNPSLSPKNKCAKKWEGISCLMLFQMFSSVWTTDLLRAMLLDFVKWSCFWNIGLISWDSPWYG